MTKRNLFPEFGPIRYIDEKDIEKPFQNRLYKKNEIDLPELLKLNCDNKHCLVFEDDDGKILAFLAVDDEGDHFYLNLVEKNEQFPDECKKRNAAAKLIDRAEDIARSRGHTKIEMQSMSHPKLVEYYKNLGYEKTGNTELNRTYGKLIDMKKNLTDLE